MRLINYLIIIFLIFNNNLTLAQNENLKNKITKNLRCLVCQGQSIYDSDSDFANSLKILVKQKLDEGQNEKQIYDYLKKSMVNGYCMIPNSIKIPIFFGYYLY